MEDMINQAKELLGVEDDDRTKLQKIKGKKSDDQLTHREELEEQELRQKQADERRAKQEDETS